MTKRFDYSFIAALSLSAAILLAACSGGGASPTPLPSASAVPVSTVAIAPATSAPSLPSITATATPATPSLPLPSAVPTVSVSPTLPASPLPRVSVLPTPRVTASPSVLARGLSQPDDLAFGPNGSFYVSDIGDGTLRQIAADGSVKLIARGLNEPEGIVPLADGSLIVAEQGRNRLVRVDPATGKISPFLQLVNRTGLLGVDGLEWDSTTSTIIVPDSADGQVLRVSTSGTVMEVLTQGMVRPTGAAFAPDGSLIVPDENAGIVYRVRLGGNGSREQIARLSLPDDVAVDNAGNVYVTSLGDHSIHRIDTVTGADTRVYGNIGDPQGILLGPDGRLIVTDAARGEILVISVLPP